MRQASTRTWHLLVKLLLQHFRTAACWMFALLVPTSLPPHPLPEKQCNSSIVLAAGHLRRSQGGQHCRCECMEWHLGEKFCEWASIMAIKQGKAMWGGPYHGAVRAFSFCWFLLHSFQRAKLATIKFSSSWWLIDTPSSGSLGYHWLPSSKALSVLRLRKLSYWLQDRTHFPTNLLVEETLSRSGVLGKNGKPRSGVLESMDTSNWKSNESTGIEYNCECRAWWICLLVYIFWLRIEFHGASMSF